MGKRKWETIFAVGLAVALVSLVVGLLVGTSSGTEKVSDTLGGFNPANHANVATAPLGEVGPGACLPSKTFNNSNGTAEVVKFLQGNDPRDTHHTAAAVAQRDVAWLSSHASYYHYTSGQTDAQWHAGLVLVQLPYPITVTNTYCPSGQDVVKIWKVQTLPQGEWVWFLKGHAPGDGTDIVPVRKAVCGNFLLPPPSSHKQPSPTPSPTPTGHKHHTPGPTPSPKPSCTKPPAPGPSGYTYHPATCTWSKPHQTYQCQQNGTWTNNCPPNKVDQPVQNNPCCNTGPTKGAGSEPSPNPVGPTPSPGQPAPPPNSGGYDSGSSDGSGTPGGTTCDSSGCSGGGSTSGSGPTDNTNSGDNNGTDGSGNSTGGGDPGNPFS